MHVILEDYVLDNVVLENLYFVSSLNGILKFKKNEKWESNIYNK